MIVNQITITPTTEDMQEYVVRGMITVSDWDWDSDDDMPTLDIITARSPDEAIKLAEECAKSHPDFEGWDKSDIDWEMSSIKMLVEVEYTQL